MQSYEQYKQSVGFKESSNRYNVKNKYGYLGKYQFGMSRLRELGYKGTAAAFLASPALQEQYFDLHVYGHKRSHGRQLLALLAKGKSRMPRLTLSGLIAFAHLVGAGAARSWAKAGRNKKDGNGIYGTAYAMEFSGFQIPGAGNL